MRLYKPTYKDKKGERKEVKKFWVEVIDRREKGYRKILRFPASESEGISKTIGNNIQKRIDCIASGEPSPTLIDYFQDYTPARLQDRLIEAGLLPARIKLSARPLLDYLPDFRDYVYQESKKNRTKKTTMGDTQARQTTARVRKLIKGCGFIVWKDVSAEKINEHIESRPDDMSQQTAHYYVQAFRRFAKWLFEQGCIDKAPKINSVSPARNYGIPFELKEFERLLEAARAGKTRYGLTGNQRYILYLLAVETGLRRDELKSLTAASIDLKSSCIFVKGGVDGATKNQDDAYQFFTPETGILLQEYIKGKMPNVRLFDIRNKSAEMIRADCNDAGIEVDKPNGKRLNFHSLRHTCGSYLATSGVSPREIMEIMRHKDINLTMHRYTHLLSGQKQKAVNKLPRFAKPKKKDERAG